jgi:hypothetical protein
MIDRKEFLNRFARMMLLALLGALSVILGRKAVSGTDCSSCPGKGICLGESDCSTYNNKR